jgi:DNA-binding HxlR family transcriptional regulator
MFCCSISNQLQNVKHQIQKKTLDDFKLELDPLAEYTIRMSNRSYHQYCGLAYALDVVGERWTLLIVRELVAGPRRFKDLLDGLPGISTNLLTERLKRLEELGLLLRRTLPPPAGSAVYELTPLGQGLEATLLEFGRWGAQFVPPTWEGAHLLNVGSYALTLKTFFRPHAAQHMDEVFELRIDNEVLQVHIHHGDLDVRQGEHRTPDVVFYTEMPVYIRLLTRQLEPEQAIADGLVRIAGDPDALPRFLDVCGLPTLEEMAAMEARAEESQSGPQSACGDMGKACAHRSLPKLGEARKG